MEIFDTMLNDQSLVLQDEQLSNLIEEIGLCMSIDRDLAPSVTDQVSEEATDELKSCFLHLWLQLAQ